MFNYKKLTHLKFIFTFIFICLSNAVFADNHNLNEILELIQKDLKTLEKAVYSGSNNAENSKNQKGFNENSEDVLTRHLLKLSEVENQFRELTNKFEEINFKIDKLSNRLSKVQVDNQLRFQKIENSLFSGDVSQKITSKTTKQWYPSDSAPAAKKTGAEASSKKAGALLHSFNSVGGESGTDILLVDAFQ